MTFHTYTSGSRRIDKISIQRIKRTLHDVSYFSDDLAFAALTAETNPTEHASKSIDGSAVIIMMTGEATLQINLKSYTIRPGTIVFFSPESIIRTERITANATGYMLAYSRSFINDIQVGLSTSLPIYMLFRKSPVLKVTQEETAEILQLFQLMKKLMHSGKERYLHEMVRSLFTTAFYLIAEINSRSQGQPPKQGRCEVIFDAFMSLLEQHCRSERNVSFYAEQLDLTPKYFSAAIKQVSGKSAARWIDEAVILEAKTLLKYSGKSIGEIAGELNFSTQSFFGKYFKQHTGESPSRYKHK